MTSLCRLIRKAPVSRESYPVMPGESRCLGPAGEPVDGAEGEDSAESHIKQAYKAGYDAGHAVCRDALGGETAAAVGDFRSMVDDLASQRKRLIKESEAAVLRVACSIARRIVGKSVEVRDEVVLEVVRNALTHMKDSHDMTIRVNPRDHQVLKGCESEWLESARSGGVKIKEDARIKPGGCLIEGESGSVEAQIDRQIDVIEKALMEACK
jgi:flagellar biosynthesis/type III secretory pathway protein FliH